MFDHTDGGVSTGQLQYGWSVPDMTVREDAGLVINWPQTRVINAWWMNQTEEEQPDPRNVVELEGQAEEQPRRDVPAPPPGPRGHSQAPE